MRTTLPLLLLVSCIPGETGFDRTVLSGTITIPPAQITDVRTNSSVETAQGLGPDETTALTWRSVVIAGKVSEWPGGLNEAEGDQDNYAFTPVDDGTFTFTMTFETMTLPVDTGADTAVPTDTADTADTGAVEVPTLDADVFDVRLIALADYDAEAGTGVVSDLSTDGSVGAFSFSADVKKGATYVLQVSPVSTDARDEELAYTVVIDGSAPTDGTILVGAYPGEDPTVRENPLGGTNATGWTYDAATATWSGTWQLMWLRQVTAVEDTDTGDLFVPSPTVEEGSGTVYLRAASLTTLNAGLAAGTLYTTTTVPAEVTNTATEVEEALVLDGVAPKVIGQVLSETLPDTTLAEIDLADYSIVEETLVAQDLGMLTGLGYVDVVTGESTLDPAATGWNGTNDSDAFAFTVPETMGVRMVASWPDGAADIDFGIWYADPDYGLIDLFSSWGDTYCLTSANPEVCESVITLEPETTYYLVALGYLGTDVQPYTIELEWSAP